MSVVNNRERLHARISDFFSFFCNKGNTCECAQSRRDKFKIESLLRTCTFCSTTPRFFQYIFPGPQNIGRTTSCDKPATPKSISHKTTFQDGHNEPTQEMRLGHKYRSGKRILSFKAQISSLLHSGQNISVTS